MLIVKLRLIAFFLAMFLVWLALGFLLGGIEKQIKRFYLRFVSKTDTI